MNTSKHHYILIFLMIMLTMPGLACRLSDVGTAVPTVAPPTLAVFATYTAVPDPAVTATHEPVANATEVVQSAPVMTTKVDLNVRRGPGTQYSIVTALRAGETAAIVGRSPDGFWWKITCPTPYGGECWSSARAEYSTAVNSQGVPVAAVPPLPTATASPTATATATFTPTATPTQTRTPVPTWTPTLTPTPGPSPYP